MRVKKRIIFAIFVLCHASLPPLAHASSLTLSGTQQLMLEASQKAVAKDFKGAEANYSQAISLDGGLIDAYLQRGLIRRELKDENGVIMDAKRALALLAPKIAASPGSPKLYYQRGTAYRLLGRFQEAGDDIQKALSLGGRSSWQEDLKAIALEAKMGR